MKIRVAFDRCGAELALPDSWRTTVLEARFAGAVD